MPNFYHKGVNSVRSQFGLLVVAKLIRNFGYPNILLKKYLPFCAVQYKLAVLFLSVSLVVYKNWRVFCCARKLCSLHIALYTCLFLVLTYGTWAVLVSWSTCQGICVTLYAGLNKRSIFHFSVGKILCFQLNPLNYWKEICLRMLLPKSFVLTAFMSYRMFSY